ncbi:MAG: type III toxin-antitoxin system ToxN/AbiQ family toxin [Clostridia bacterium]|nr:type III toxin-antitoxin system ToxN/AbiQ family toxin [Clostridia bacterium]
MILNLRIVKVDSNYCNYLRIFDSKVIYNMDNKESRPYIGVLFEMNHFEYYAPLTSPKPKHLKMKNTIDFYKIKNGQLGAINLNNMIPVTNYNYTLINLNEKVFIEDKVKYLTLLKEQLNWLNSNYIQIIFKLRRNRLNYMKCILIINYQKILNLGVAILDFLN